MNVVVLAKHISADPKLLDEKSVIKIAPQPKDRNLSIVSTVQDFAKLEQQWLALEEKSASPSGLFQSFAWLQAWSKVYIQPGGRRELCVITGFEGGQLVFAWPLMRVRQGPLYLLHWLSEPSGQYGDILLASDHCARTWMAQALRLTAQLKKTDGIWLRHVREDAHAAVFLASRFDNCSAPEFAPYLDLTAFANEEAYDARYTAVQRKRRKKIKKSLERTGPLVFRQVPSGQLSDAAIETAVAEKNIWLKQRNRHNRILYCPEHVRFIKELMKRRDPSLETIVTEMSSGKEPISWEIGFNYRGTHYGFITAHKVELTELSPSRLHMDLSQRLSLKQGMKRFDLMVPNDPHKQSWSSGKVAVDDYYTPLSLAGRLYGNTYLRAIRPRIRDIYHSAPQWMLGSAALITALFHRV